MDLIADRGRRISVEDLSTSQLLAHARKQARERNLDDILVVDVDSHHYETECYDEFLPFMENDVLRQLTLSGRAKGRQSIMPSQVGFQDMGGRITRYPMRSSEKTKDGKLRDVQLGHRWMDAMGVDYACLFPTMMLAIGLHPADGDGSRALPRLQSLAHRKGFARGGRPLLLHAGLAVFGSGRVAPSCRDVW